MNELEIQLRRRGFYLGVAPVSMDKAQSHSVMPESTDESSLKRAYQSIWKEGGAVFLPGICAAAIENHTDAIKEAYSLYESLLEGDDAFEDLLDQAPYASRLATSFESLGSSMNEGDDQEIETVFFDAINSNDLDSNDLDSHDAVLAEDLWVKASWLSFHEEDASLRFRFSFGVDLHEDVAADIDRQHHAATLTEAIFPESVVITDNQALFGVLSTVLGSSDIQFVERIVYFNSDFHICTILCERAVVA